MGRTPSACNDGKQTRDYLAAFKFQVPGYNFRLISVADHKTGE